MTAAAPRLTISSYPSTAGSPEGFDTPDLKNAKALLDELG
jgi:hypothetical protein